MMHDPAYYKLNSDMFITPLCFSPPPEITWSRSNHNLHSGQISLLPHEAELTISNMTESDGGDYVCAAKNYKGNASYIHNIRVEGMSEHIVCF